VKADPVVRLSFPAKADYLLLARLALAGIARSLPLDQEELADLKLAVTEACGNAVRHAYVADGGSVEVAFVVGSDSLEMVVEDQGSGIDETDDDEQPEPLEGGMGMSIIRAVMDDVDVRDGKDGRGTVVRMTKYLTAVSD